MKLRARVSLDILSLSAGIALLAAAAAVYVYGRERAFSGEIRIPAGAAESVAVREAPADVPQGAATFSADAIPFDQAGTRDLLGAGNKRYEYVRLPHSLHMEEASVISEQPVINELEVSGVKSERFHVQEKGDVTIGGAAYTVSAIRKWAGLMREHTGLPAAAIALSQDGKDWAENIVIGPGKWQALDDTVTVRFEWAESPEAAAAVLENAPGLEEARWGIVDGNAVNWFHSFEPGMGLDLRAGGSVMLVEVEPSRPALLVEIRNKKETRTAVITPNSDAEPLIKFEHPAAKKHAIRLAAWRDNAAQAVLFVDGKAAGRAELEAGAVWKPEGAPWALRLDQAYEYAAPVKADDSPLYEVVLRRADNATPQYLRVRQGEQVTLGDTRIGYTRTAPPPVVNYTISARAADGRKLRRLTVGPGDEAACGDWVLEQVPSSPEPLAAALLRVRYHPKRGMHTYFIAAGLVLIIWPLLHTLKGNAPAE